jgi:hypothetical protein
VFQLYLFPDEGSFPVWWVIPFSMCPHIAKRVNTSSLISLIGLVTHPCELIKLLTTNSHVEVGLQHMNLGGHNSMNNTHKIHILWPGGPEIASTCHRYAVFCMSQRALASKDSQDWWSGRAPCLA